MSGWSAAVMGLLFVMNPPGVSRSVGWGDRVSGTWRRHVVTVLTANAMVLVLAGLLAAPILRAADLSTPTFRLGAALVVGLTGAKWMLSPATPITHVETDRESATTLTTLLLTPGPVLAAMTANSDGGTLAGLVSVVVAVAATLVLLLLPPLGETSSAAATRFVGALALVVAVATGINSARTV